MNDERYNTNYTPGYYMHFEGAGTRIKKKEFTEIWSREFQLKVVDVYGTKDNLKFLKYLERNRERWVTRYCLENFVGTYTTTNRNESGNALLERLIRKPEDLIKVVQKSEELANLPGNRPIYYTIEPTPSHPLLKDIEN